MNDIKPDTTQRRGHCLCGAVTFVATRAGNKVTACHCGMCRRWGGGPFMEIDCGSDVQIQGEENISVFDSSAWAERGFCGQCGSHLFYRIKGTDELQMPVGLFEQDDQFVFEQQVFIDAKPAYYRFANRTSDMTSAEVYAKYGPGE